MTNVTFNNDLNEIVEMNISEFRESVISTIDFAINEKDYDLNDLTVNFIAEDISGIVESFHNLKVNMNDLGLSIIDEVLKDLKSKRKSAIVRPVNGIALNGYEYLLNDDNSVKLFNDRIQALNHILELGLSEDDEVSIIDYYI